VINGFKNVKINDTGRFGILRIPSITTKRNIKKYNKYDSLNQFSYCAINIQAFSFK
jgi:hypothetical protein